jgi:hypothetical protein
MAEVTIQLQIDPQSGKKNVIIRYRSDEDALPVEHEEDHRRLVDQLVEGGVLKAQELGKVVVERESAEGVPAETPREQGEQQRESVKEPG